ncbi:MAG TPA: uracil-DNA glycosylase [Gammaproteobacteria bacterium]|nr:uracil-DNA glycosylase [Gammaproteobacteria bacterium]
MQDWIVEQSWKQALATEFNAPYMANLKAFLQQEKQQNKIIYPRFSQIFSAFNYAPIDQVCVVILGQDPYHGPKQAHGMCFSVMPGVRPPPSLVNIYKELKADLGVEPVNHGCLIPWAKQGVLLLNAVLTVEQGKPGSHQGKGWEHFTDQVIGRLNAGDKPIIFVLWGSHAQQKGQQIDAKKHVILRAAHPSPFSAHRGFLGCKHFSQINKLLTSWGQTPINWQLPKEIVLEEIAIES